MEPAVQTLLTVDDRVIQSKAPKQTNNRVEIVIVGNFLSGFVYINYAECIEFTIDNSGIDQVK